MSDLEWIQEKPSLWNEDKERIIGGIGSGVYDRRYSQCRPGDLLPGEWWRVERDGKPLGYGWLDVVWGDAEILLAVDPELQGDGLGSFILTHLEAEAMRLGVNYLYNIVRETHPFREKVTAWLQKRGFGASEDGSLFRSVSRTSGA